jgi:hypothetical protein
MQQDGFNMPRGAVIELMNALAQECTKPYRLQPATSGTSRCILLELGHQSFRISMEDAHRLGQVLTAAAATMPDGAEWYREIGGELTAACSNWTTGDASLEPLANVDVDFAVRAVASQGSSRPLTARVPHVEAALLTAVNALLSGGNSTRIVSFCLDTMFHYARDKHEAEAVKTFADYVSTGASVKNDAEKLRSEIAKLRGVLLQKEPR